MKGVGCTLWTVFRAIILILQAEWLVVSGVSPLQMAENTIRLVNGSRADRGRLEVYHNGRWGTVCDDNFGDTDATAICRLLGYTDGTSDVTAAGPGSGEIWLDQLDCPENLTTITECGHTGWGTHNCGHEEDVRLRCTDVICERNYTLPRGTNKCIKYFSERKTWQEAEDACVANGGHLISIHSKREQEAITVVLPEAMYSSYNELDDVWIGMNDMVREGTRVWTDGTDTDYTLFDSGEPNNGCGSCARSGDSDCFRMYPESFNPPHLAWEWGDKPCSLVARYLCQRPSSCRRNPCQNGGSCAVSIEGDTKCNCPPGYGGDFCESGVSCPAGYNLTRSHDKCLRYFSEMKRWEVAEMACEEDGGHLVSIHSAAEQADVASILPTDYASSFKEDDDVWMGMNDQLREGSLRWTDGSPVNYRHFCPGEPNNGCGSCRRSGDSDCFRLYPTCSRKPGWVWGDKPCSLTARYVCQVPPERHCLSNPCLNGANCSITQSGRTQCLCPDGYDGNLCETDVDVCGTTECANGGTCEEGVGANYTCHCARGFEGTQCETEIDECLANPCKNGGSCVDGPGWYFCHCPNGFMGHDCQTDACSTFPCLHDSLCVTGADGPYCECGPGFHGTHCEHVVSKCEDDSCQNGGTCVDAKGSLLCLCGENFYGPSCEHDNCKRHPCLNGGECKITPHGTECFCGEGFIGKHCEINTDHTPIVHQISAAAQAMKPDSSQKSDSSLYVAAIVCGVGALLIVLILLAVLFLRRKKRPASSSDSPAYMADWESFNNKVQFQYQKAKLDGDDDD